MNKDVNPIVALIVIMLVLFPLLLWGWASGERALQVAGSFYLEKTPSNQLSIQVDHLLIRQNQHGTDAESFDLGQIGVENPKGNVTYFNDGDLLVRAGKSAYSLAVYATMKEATNSESEARQQELGEQIEGNEPLLKCNQSLEQCEIIGSLSAPWHHRLFIDQDHQFIHVIDGLGHVVRSYDQYGKLLSKLKSGLRYPKRIRCHSDRCYLIDTNNRRLLFIKQSDSGGYDLDGELNFEKLGDSFNWIIDAHYVNKEWWVISADNSMRTSKVNIFDQDGRFQKRLKLNAHSEPFDLLVKDQDVLISDIATGTIYRFSANGRYLDEIKSDKVKAYYKTMKEEQEKYGLYVDLSKVFLIVLFIFGLVLFLFMARRKQ